MYTDIIFLKYITHTMVEVIVFMNDKKKQNSQKSATDRLTNRDFKVFREMQKQK
mgnify:CR=1 FL=1